VGGYCGWPSHAGRVGCRLAAEGFTGCESKPYSRAGSAPGALNSQSLADFPAAHRSTIGTTAPTSGTVRARRFFNVSTQRAPPPLLHRTALDRRARAPLGRSRLHLVRAHRDRPGHRDRPCAHSLQRVEDPDLKHDLGLGSRGHAGGLGDGTAALFHDQLIQLAVAWAAFAIFLVALISL
jgi:hypothetical protein